MKKIFIFYFLFLFISGCGYTSLYKNNDIKKNLYKEISSQIQELEIASQNSSRIVVNVELKYVEKIIRETGELINQTSLSPLKVKYILGFSNKSWKLADFISGQ